MNHGPIEAFRLAPMARAFRWLTVVLLALPVLFLVLALSGELPFLAFVALLAVYAGVYFFWRPTRFEVSPRGLDIVFPTWRRRLPARSLAAAREFTLADFRREFGWGLRIGAGGLWGGFGWLWTRKGLVEFYISRADQFVLVERRAGRPLLITPERPPDMVRAVRLTVPGAPP